VKQWQVTQCLLCSAVSPHDDWYHDHAEDVEHDAAVVERELELVEV